MTLITRIGLLICVQAQSPHWILSTCNMQPIANGLLPSSPLHCDQPVCGEFCSTFSQPCIIQVDKTLVLDEVSYLQTYTLTMYRHTVRLKSLQLHLQQKDKYNFHLSKLSIIYVCAHKPNLQMWASKPLKCRANKSRLVKRRPAC